MILLRFGMREFQRFCRVWIRVTLSSVRIGSSWSTVSITIYDFMLVSVKDSSLDKLHEFGLLVVD